MSTIISESNAMQKCSSKIVDPKGSTKNGLVNGLLHKKSPQMDNSRHDDISEPVETLVSPKLDDSGDVTNNQAESCKDEDTAKSNIGKSKRKAKKKKHKTQLDSNENLKDINEPMPDLGNTDESVPSSSKDSGCVAGEDICDAISNDIEKLAVTNDNIVETQEVPSQDEIREQRNKQVEFVPYESELQMPMIMKIIQKDLSEPYSIYTYRYFIHNWPKLCFLAMADGQCVGAIVCKLDLHRKVIRRGYIAMLAVDQNYRKLRIGSTLVQMAIHEMINGNADEVVLETEVTNKPALKLYEKLGFVRDKRLFRYYLNGVDALRLKLWLR